jgi:peptidoglycan/LPS O-acetylase OafA/YrhL
MTHILHTADWMGTAKEERKWAGVDGLRGTAILAVLICHYSSLLPKTHPLLGVLENGWAGVDLFFVISGFLITGILLDAKGKGHYFRNFYVRRILRIFPIYYALLAGILSVLVVCRFARGISADSRQLWDGQAWLWTYTGNVWMARQQVWSTAADVVMPLWSLSVEEQFYLVWPVIVFWLSRRALMGICIGVMAGAAILRFALTACGTGYFAIYVWAPTRADSLAAGALMALLIRAPGGEQLARKPANYAGIIAAMLLLILCQGFDPIHHPWLRDGLYSILAVLFAVILFWSIDRGSLGGMAKRFYELRILRAAGGYSYGIYLFHMPILYLSGMAARRLGFYDPTQPNWVGAMTLIAFNAVLTLAIALASFHLYEKRFLRLKRYFRHDAGE